MIQNLLEEYDNYDELLDSEIKEAGLENYAESSENVVEPSEERNDDLYEEEYDFESSFEDIDEEDLRKLKHYSPRDYTYLQHNKEYNNYKADSNHPMYKFFKSWYTGDANYPDNKVPGQEAGNKLPAGIYAGRAFKKWQETGNWKVALGANEGKDNKIDTKTKLKSSALGRLQIIEGTRKQAYKKLGIPFDKGEMLYKTDENFQSKIEDTVAEDMLSRIYKQTGGMPFSPNKGLSSSGIYNTGMPTSQGFNPSTVMESGTEFDTILKKIDTQGAGYVNAVNSAISGYRSIKDVLGKSTDSALTLMNNILQNRQDKKNTLDLYKTLYDDDLYNKTILT